MTAKPEESPMLPETSQEPTKRKEITRIQGRSKILLVHMGRNTPENSEMYNASIRLLYKRRISV